MKKLICLLIVGILAMPSLFAKSATYRNIIAIHTTITVPQPMSLEEMPISAYFDDVQSSVTTTFYQNMGYVTVTLTNETTGETSTTTVNSSLGSSTIQTSGTAGTWSILYVTPLGTTYEGEFTIS
jgi:hypothetical protein